MSVGASPQTPMGELTVRPRYPNWFQWAASRQERNGGKGRAGGGEREKERKGGIGEDKTVSK